MKKSIYMVLLLFLSFTANAQIRHAKGLRGLDLSYVATDLNAAVRGGYLMYLSNKIALKGDVTMDFGTQFNNRSAVGLLADFNVAYGLYNLGNKLFFNSYGGLTFSYDQVSNAEAYFTSGGFNYGLNISPEVEYFFNDYFSVITGLPIRYLFADEFGGLRVQFNLGVRYNF